MAQDENQENKSPANGWTFGTELPLPVLPHVLNRQFIIAFSNMAVNW
jgi:hypothetical protein